MNTHVKHLWKGILVVVVVFAVLLLGLVLSVQALESAAASQAVTLRTTVREPSGKTGTVAFTFALEELPAASAVLPNASTLPPQPSAVPEPATLVLVSLGGLGVLRKIWYTQ
jgi:hypothetical protein